MGLDTPASHDSEGNIGPVLPRSVSREHAKAANYSRTVIAIWFSDPRISAEQPPLLWCMNSRTFVPALEESACPKSLFSMFESDPRRMRRRTRFGMAGIRRERQKRVIFFQRRDVIWFSAIYSFP